MKISRKDLEMLIESYILENHPINENAFRGIQLTGFITLITPDVITLASKGSGWKKAIKSIVKKAGSAQKALNNAYDILNSGLIKNVIGLAAPGYRKKATQVAKSAGMSLKQYSKKYPPFDLPYIQKLVDYCNSAYPGILNDKLVSKFRRVLKKLLLGLNPHILADNAVDAIFYNKPYVKTESITVDKETVVTPKPESIAGDKETVVTQKEEEVIDNIDDVIQNSEEYDPIVFGMQDDTIPKSLARGEDYEEPVSTPTPKPSQSKEVIYKIPGDKTWEYTKINGKWHTRKIGSKKFINISKNSKAVNSLNQKLKDNKLKINESIENQNTLMRKRYRLRY